MKKDPKIFLEHILKNIEKVEEYIGDTSKNSFLKNTQLQDAIIRKIEIIGEAVKNLPLSFKNKYSKIPWKEIAGTRDIFIHEYFDVDLNLVWEIVKKDIPKFKKQILMLSKDF